MMDDSDSSKTSLQKNVLIMSAVCEMLSICMISSNISRYSEVHSSVYTGIFVLSITIMIIWMVAFFGVIYKFQFLIYFVWITWAFIAFLWLFFISGCISRTNCPEGLWFIENDDRAGVPISSAIEFYYHEYHSSFPDEKPKKKDAELDIKEFDEISYVVDYVPLIKFNGFYRPWSSAKGAVVYIFSFSLTFIFFTLTLMTLWQYAREIDPSHVPRVSSSTGCWKCNRLSCGLKTDHTISVIKQSTAPRETAAELDPYQTPNVDHCRFTSNHSLHHGSQRRQKRVRHNNREVCETPLSSRQRQQVPAADDGQTCDEQLGLLTRLARYVCKRSANRFSG